MCEDLLRNDSATSPSPPLFPPPAPSPSPSPCPFNFSYDDDIIDAIPNVIPIPTPDLQVQQQPSQQQVQHSVIRRPRFISHPNGTILCVLNQKRGSILLDTSLEQSLFESVSLESHSQV